MPSRNAGNALGVARSLGCNMCVVYLDVLTDFRPISGNTNTATIFYSKCICCSMLNSGDILTTCKRHHFPNNVTVMTRLLVKLKNAKLGTC